MIYQGPRKLRSRVYVLTPPELAGTYDLADYVRAAIAGGAGMIQYRAKGASTRTMLEDCQSIIAMLRRAEVPLIVNDRVDVALAVGADGVHVGPEDMPVAWARRMMGPEAIVGATAPTPRLARQADDGGASYVSVGPMFASRTAPEKPPIGPEAIEPVRRACKLPICAIGGITAENLEAVAAAGPDLVAVTRAVFEAPDWRRAVAELVEMTRELLPGEVEI